MALIEHDSRNRIGIDWYDDEAEAVEAGERARNSLAAADANIGYVQCGRDWGFDKVKDGVKLYAVVTP